MPNQDNIPNHAANDEDNEVQPNSIITIIIHVIIVIEPIIEGPTVIGVEAIDERIYSPQDLTNEEINEAILLPSDQYVEEILKLIWLTFMLYIFILYQYWPLFVLELINYHLRTNANPLVFRPSNDYVIPSDLLNPNRDAQAEGRTAQATADPITFSSTVEMVEPVAFGVQATVQAHETALLVDLANAQNADPIINHENPDTTAGELGLPHIQNDPIVPTTTITTEDNLPEPVVDNPRCNVNPIDPVEPHDDVYSSDSSDEGDRIASSGSGSEGDNEDSSSSDEDDQTRITTWTSPVPEDSLNRVENNVPSDHRNTTNEQLGSIIPPLHEALDNDGNVNSPDNATERAIVPPNHSTTSTNTPKPVTTIVPNNETSDAQSN